VIQDEVAPGENDRMTHTRRILERNMLLGLLVGVAIHVGYRTIARDERANITESSRQLSETADAEPTNRALVLASHRPERRKSRFDQANLVIRSMVVPDGRCSGTIGRWAGSQVLH